MGDSNKYQEYLEEADPYGKEYIVDEVYTYSDEEESNPPSVDLKITPADHVQQAEEALLTLKQLEKDSDWRKAFTHKSGVSIWSKSGTQAQPKIPVFRGEGIIKGFAPQTVFEVIGMRQHWDDWYEEGNLVENLNSSTSLTYMVMHAFPGSKPRDLALVEKIECTSSGNIYFVSTSVKTPKVPHVSNKIRANLELNGWILKPIKSNPPSTKLTYILQTEVKGWFPSFAVKRYLLRRPLVINTIDMYLQKHESSTGQTSRTGTDISKQTFSWIGRDTSSEPHELKRKASLAESIEEKAATNVINGSSQKSSSLISSKRSSPSKGMAEPESTTKTEKTNEPSDSNKLEVETSSSSETAGLTRQAPSHQEPASPMSSISHSSLKLPEPTHKQHRHSEAAKSALDTFKTYAASLDGWEKQSENKGVKIYFKDVPNKSMPLLRGEATISGGWTAEQILAMVNDLNMRTLWDDRFEEGETIEQLGLNDQLTKSSMKGIFPISGRDLSIVSTTERDKTTGIIWLAGKSVLDPLIPEKTSHTRAQLDLVGWLLRPHFDSSGYTTSVEVTYIVDIDIKLDVIPSSILKKISVSTPMCLAKIDETLQKVGYPPYIRNTSGQILSTEFKPNDKIYELNLTDMSGGFVELCICRKMYPTGFDVTVNPEDSKVELLPSNTEVIRISVPANDSNTLNVKLIKQPSNSEHLTINGKNKIPLVTDTTGNEDLDVSTLVNPPTLKIQPPPSDNKQNPSVSPTRTAIIKQTFFTPPTPQEISYQKEKLLQNEIPRIIAASKAEATTNQTDTTITSYVKSIIPSTINYQKQMETYTNAKNSIKKEAMVISSQARFNSQQVGLMFASMLLAYYAGKLSGSQNKTIILKPSSTSSPRSPAKSLSKSLSTSVSFFKRIINSLVYSPGSFLFVELKQRALTNNGSWRVTHVLIIGGLVAVITLFKFRKGQEKRQHQAVQQDPKAQSRLSLIVLPHALKSEHESHRESGILMKRESRKSRQQDALALALDQANHRLSTSTVSLIPSSSSKFTMTTIPTTITMTIVTIVTNALSTLTYFYK